MTSSVAGPSLVALLVVLAGCSAVGAGPVTPPAVTPAPVPTDEPTPTELAPGLTADGVDPDALAAAHAAALSDASYTRHGELTVRNTSGALRTRIVRVTRYDPGPDRGHVVVNISGDATAFGIGLTRWEYWMGDRAFTAIGYAGASFPQVIRPAEGRNPTTEAGHARLFDDVVDGGDIRFVFDTVDGGEFEVTTAGDAGAYRVDGASPDDGDGRTPSGEAARGSSIRNASLAAIVSRDGIVHWYRFSYSTTINGDPVRVTRTVGYAGIGSTQVDRPPWYDEAVDTTRVRQSITTGASNVEA